MVVLSVCMYIYIYIYGVEIIKKFRWESGFLKGGSMELPLCTNGSAGYLMQLSVNDQLYNFCLLQLLYVLTARQLNRRGRS